MAPMPVHYYTHALQEAFKMMRMILLYLFQHSKISISSNSPIVVITDIGTDKVCSDFDPMCHFTEIQDSTPWY